MSRIFNIKKSKGSKAIPLEAPRQVFLLIWPALPHHWGIFLPDRYSTSSSGKIWHVRVMDMKVKQHEHRSKHPSKLLKLLSPCTEKGVDILKENHILKSEKCKIIKIEDTFATESTIDSIVKKIEPTFHYEAVHENCQTFVVEVMRELESHGFATREAVDFVRRQSLASVRVAAWNRERRHPLPDVALNNLGARAPRVDWSSTTSANETPRASDHSSSGASTRSGSDTQRKIAEINRAKEERRQTTRQVRYGVNSQPRQARLADSARGTPHRSHVREVASYGTEFEMPGSWVE
ncbi:uncharacterized protein N0V89_006349 [Didymosphaeria variabile]|uniref:Uncharacterized protein n=1 Tax=Didymosphaeria variabile TaxID=1932322 RepID=A0A9W8XMD2_9PLEO|nr:uncharacterized protein N0V89_006349 [Didymosphaeria variabile]KAJ4354612.1 hypothetical protein N0V89_006349 [Didymosphaeria variabile]